MDYKELVLQKESDDLWNKINKIGGGDFWRKLPKKEFEIALRIFGSPQTVNVGSINKTVESNTITSTEFKN